MSATTTGEKHQDERRSGQRRVGDDDDLGGSGRTSRTQTTLPSRGHPALAEIHSSPRSTALRIFLVWLVGAFFAVLHHILNSQLENRPVRKLGPTADGVFLSQQGASAVGTSIAYLAAAALATSASMAYIQCAWSRVLRRPFTVSGLDALWSAPETRIAFLERYIWRSAPGMVLFAIALRGFSLVVTFAPGTLTVRRDVDNRTQTFGVPTFSFTNSGALYEVEQNDADKSYVGPSSLALRVVGATLFGGDPFMPVSPCDGNCSYTLFVAAPAFSCNQSDAPPVQTVGTPQSYLYQSELFNNTSPGASNPYSNWDFRTFYSDHAPDGTIGTRKQVVCVAFNATYEVFYNFTGVGGKVVVRNRGGQSSRRRRSWRRNDGAEIYFSDVFRFVWQLLAAGSCSCAIISAPSAPYAPTLTSPNVTNNQEASQLHVDDADASTNALRRRRLVVPDNDSNFTHSPSFNGASNYYALLSSLYFFSVGQIFTSSSTNSTLQFSTTPERLAVRQSQLVSQSDSRAIIWAGDLAQAFESLLQNVTLSLLQVDPRQTAAVPCTVLYGVQRFEYDPTQLWIVYALGLGLALGCNLLGFAALRANAFGADADFSSFVLATRFSRLEGVDPDRLGKVALRYGRLGDGGEYGFARESELQHGGGHGGGARTEKGAPLLPVNSSQMSLRHENE
ncbi:hypothetical protein MKEN_00287900 [Mycena kentingensis (nom. inval.)]|nr:hypothetical protein MKEN_00287900 [Mycena kentingensis (nom. inval.)]